MFYYIMPLSYSLIQESFQINPWNALKNSNISDNDNDTKIETFQLNNTTFNPWNTLKNSTLPDNATKIEPFQPNGTILNPWINLAKFKFTK